MDQIIKFGISNYLQLCVEAGFSQIQSHIKNLHSIETLQLNSQFFRQTRKTEKTEKT